jgi:hypothetical protein
MTVLGSARWSPVLLPVALQTLWATVHQAG